MRKLTLTVIGLYIGILGAFSQKLADTSTYRPKKLKVSEINFVTAYYHQDGNLSPVTGGIGPEKLSDIATTIDLKLFKYDNKGRKHDLGVEVGVDHYTSASSDQIDPHTISSASHADTRVYPSINYAITNEQTGNAVNFNASYSNEYDYQSLGFGTGFTKTSKDQNTEFGVKLQAFLDHVKLILPIELRPTGQRGDDNDYASTPRNSFSGTLTFSQMLTERFQLALTSDIVYQTGFLSTPFHRIYFPNGTETTEKLPSSRFKIPVGLRANYFIGDKVVVRSFYRFYHDDWALNAHTFEIELPVKVTPFMSVSPFYRYYSQNGVKYFAGYKLHSPNESFYTTDDDLSKFNSSFEGVGFRFAPPGGLFGIKHWNDLELRYGHYNRTDKLHSDIITLALKFK